MNEKFAISMIHSNKAKFLRSFANEKNKSIVMVSTKCTVCGKLLVSRMMSDIKYPGAFWDSYSKCYHGYPSVKLTVHTFT